MRQHRQLMEEISEAQTARTLQLEQEVQQSPKVLPELDFFAGRTRVCARNPHGEGGGRMAG